MFESGLAEAIGNAFISLGGSSASLILVTLLAVAFSVFMTELTSNTASANMIIPIIIAVSNAADISPIPPVLGSAIGCQGGRTAGESSGERGEHQALTDQCPGIDGGVA